MTKRVKFLKLVTTTYILKLIKTNFTTAFKNVNVPKMVAHQRCRNKVFFYKKVPSEIKFIIGIQYLGKIQVWFQKHKNAQK